MNAFLLLLLLTLVILTQCDGRAQNDIVCPVHKSNGVRFFLTGRRNETGHRLISTTVSKNAEIGSCVCSDDNIDVVVEYGTTTCQGTEIVSISADIVAPQARFPPDDYEFIPTFGYYKMHTIAQNWEDARRTCIKEGGHLLILNSQAEADLVEYLWSRNPNFQGAVSNDWAFVGFNDKAKEGQYVTVYGEPLSSTGYLQWANGEPDNGPVGNEPDQDCGVTQREGKLGSGRCLIKRAFICEQELRCPN